MTTIETINNQIQPTSGNAFSVANSSSQSSRFIRRLLFFRKLRKEGNAIFKTRSELLTPSHPKILASLLPFGTVQAQSIVTKHKGNSRWLRVPVKTEIEMAMEQALATKLGPKVMDKFRLLEHQKILFSFISNKVAKIQLASGALVCMDLPQLCDYLERTQQFFKTSMLKGWVSKEESQGLVGGNPPKRKFKGSKRRPKRQGRRQPTTNRELTTSNLNVPRSLPPQYARNIWSYISSVSSDASGRFSFYTNIRNPAKAINGSGQYVRAVEDAKIWDGYYVRSYIMQMVPIIPTTVTAGAVIGAIDQEGVSPVSTPTYDSLVDRRYRFMFSGRQSKTMSIRPKPLTSGTFEGRVCPIIESGKKIFYDYEFPPDQGILEVAGEGFPATSALFQIFLWMEVINYSPRTLPGTQPRVPQTTSEGKPVPNPLPVLPLRRRNSL